MDFIDHDAQRKHLLKYTMRDPTKIQLEKLQASRTLVGKHKMAKIPYLCPPTITLAKIRKQALAKILFQLKKLNTKSQLDQLTIWDQ